MRRNCNLELRLVPPRPLVFSDDHRQNDRQEKPREGMDSLVGNSKETQNQQLTIFYDGKVSVCDVTELQARTIIKVASEEMEEKWRSRTPGSAASEPPSPLMASPSGLSMKKSLQRFLQKRKHRIQATSPYHH